jgi:hypothetical protein
MPAPVPRGPAGRPRTAPAEGAGSGREVTGTVATVYADLLSASVAGDSGAWTLPVPDLVQALAACRIPSVAARAGGQLDVATAVADELRYDTLLVVLCRRTGVDVDLRAFGRPMVERLRLEHALDGLGILTAAADGRSGAAENGAAGRAPGG